MGDIPGHIRRRANAGRYAPPAAEEEEAEAEEGTSVSVVAEAAVAR
jgi:hypothetical protein